MRERSEGEAPSSVRVEVLRRGLHIGGALCLVYYLLPPVLFGDPVWWVLWFAPLVLTVFEVLRLSFQWDLPALRPHERHRPASYVAWGAALVLAVAFFPEGVAVPCVLGAALVDPLLGILRRAPPSLRRIDPWVPYAVYVALVTVASLIVGDLTIPVALVFAVVVGAVAIASERPNLGWLDDDLLMTLLPALVWVPLSWVVPGAHALAFQGPWQTH